MTTNQQLSEVLLLIPCCGSKKGTSPAPPMTSAALSEELSPDSLALLDEGRQLAFSSEPNAIDLSSPLLPAVTWYTGRPYNVDGFRPSLDSVLTLGLRCLIVSAGYGLLRPDDPIHKYDLTMQRTLGIWRRRLPRILADYVSRNGARRVFGVLSAKYHEAVAPLERLLPDVAVKWLVPSFGETESGAALQVIPEKVAQGVISLIESSFDPGRTWRGELDQPSGSARAPGSEVSPRRQLASATSYAEKPPTTAATRKAGASPNAADFRARLHLLFEKAGIARQTNLILRASDLHRQVGGYPGPSHRMASCCQVMLGEMQVGDEILGAPPSGRGPSLTIRYRLPRKQAQ